MQAAIPNELAALHRCRHLTANHVMLTWTAMDEG